MGVFAKRGGGEVSLTWPLGRLWERERMSGIRWKVSGKWGGNWRRWEIGKLGFWKSFDLWRKERNRKRKEM